MFDPAIYRSRRTALARAVGKGSILLLGNAESPRNYAAATYPFRQDSTFLYYFGIDRPGLAATIDAGSARATVFGDDPTVEQIVWTGRRPTLPEEAERAGAASSAPTAKLQARLGERGAPGAGLHFLPPYRADNALRISRLLGLHPDAVAASASVELIRAVAAQRIVKGPEEIAEMERAVTASVAMHRAAALAARPGVTELAIAHTIHATARAKGCDLAYASIATCHGEVLHIEPRDEFLQAGRLLLVDAGAESPLRYAADLSTTVPASGRFEPRQREILAIVLAAYDAAVAALAPGTRFLEVHRRASCVLAAGLRDLQLLRGDPGDAVERGAHALFFPCGVGHLLGLDAHDMEDLGEEHMGYAGETRSSQFGLASLRLTRRLEPGFALTIEPGLYFIPELMDSWQAEGRFRDIVDYPRLESWRSEGGCRFEEDYLVTAAGSRRLGPPLPRGAEAVESLMA